MLPIIILDATRHAREALAEALGRRIPGVRVFGAGTVAEVEQRLSTLGSAVVLVDGVGPREAEAALRLGQGGGGVYVVVGPGAAGAGGGGGTPRGRSLATLAREIGRLCATGAEDPSLRHGAAATGMGGAERDAADSLAVDAALTVREREVLEQMRAGLTNKEIARRLGIRPATVKNHVHSILGKLGVSRRGAAVARLQ